MAPNMILIIQVPACLRIKLNIEFFSLSHKILQNRKNRNA
jgi:hypothetical protein